MSAVIEPFLIRAMAAAVGLAIVAAPLGCVVVWSRMAYFGETVAQASLVGIVLGLLLGLDLTFSVLVVTSAVAGLLLLLGRQKVLPIDSILGLMHHGTLAIGVIGAALLTGPAIDLVGYLFGDIYAVTDQDLYWIFGGGAAVLAALYWLWQPLLQLAVHEDLAVAEGIGRWVMSAFTVMLALTIAIAIKIVGVLLAIAFLIVPVVAARPLSATPERMVLLTAAVAVASSLIGIWLSVRYDAPGGPSIVLVMALVAGLSLTVAGLRGAR
jgi:zinc transport system permease protein